MSASPTRGSAGSTRPLHDRIVAEYRAADAAHLDAAAQRVLRAVAEHIVAARDAVPRRRTGWSSTRPSLKRRHLPMRQLFAAAPDVLTALKPCWAMSPLVVSQLLPADRQYFDVVIFDEASQVTPADAVPAILRGRQIVVAGDEHQLPPTAFFAAPADAGDGAGRGHRRRRDRPVADQRVRVDPRRAHRAAAGVPAALALPQPGRPADRLLQRSGSTTGRW